VHEATLTSRSTLTGIVWPDDVKPRTSLTVLCPRGGASHDIGVLLPEIEPTVTFLGPVPDEPAAEPICTCTPEWCYVGDDVPNTALASECRVCAWLSPADPCPAREEAEEAELLAEPEPVTDGQLAAITGTLTALASVETPLPSPADLPRGDAPTEQMDAVPAAEQTAIVGHSGVINWPTDEPSDTELESLEVIDLDRDYRPRWRRALAFVRTNWTPARAVYVAATGGSFVDSLVTWLVTR